MERAELDAIEARIRTRLDDPATAEAQAEVAAVDVESALAMLRDELLGAR